MCTRLNSVIKSGVVILNRLLLSGGKCMKRGNDSLAFVVHKNKSNNIECFFILVFWYAEVSGKEIATG